MAFVQLEDMQGQCEAVFFPGVYQKFKEYLQEERVVMVKGKAQTRGARTSVLVDTLQTAVEFGRARADERDRDLTAAPPQIPAASFAGEYDASAMPPAAETLEDNDPVDLTDFSFSDEMADEPPAGFDSDAAADHVDAPVETGRYSETPLFSSGKAAERTAAEGGSSLPAAQEREEPAISDPVAAGAVEETPNRGPDAAGAASSRQSSGSNGGASSSPATKGPPEAAAPAAPNGNQLLRITCSRSGRFERDKYRLREIFDAVRDPRGRDQFIVVMETNGSRHQLTFPNEFCTVSDRLLHDLRNHFKVEVAVERDAKLR